MPGIVSQPYVFAVFYQTGMLSIVFLIILIITKKYNYG